MDDAQKRKEHCEKYKDLPIEQIPNFNLKRPLTPDELAELKLVAMCEYDTEVNRKNWLRNIVLCGNIDAFLKTAQMARKSGYYEVVKREEVNDRVTDVVSWPVPFPPVMER